MDYTMDAEDKVLVTKFEDINVNDLNNFFQDMFSLKDLCDDFVELFKKEERYYTNEEKYNEILDEEVEVLNYIHQLSEEIREGYEEVIAAFYSRRIERKKERLMKAFKEVEKKPKHPKEEDK
ncbi:hypothetical protein EDI_274940 [Entamoeba dispar SAW760]|uniref:Uncharacterized protein n=1 Tax=Entamoeba dispar (strain ATCC PRA-260 / SAW760) TaxID=370354 RepID=B0EJ19_ENTDS|nr:uncharacterized protein EDI_274940 [Entamoeba dispar SAW760]EDR25479.1 hypothetical protein EDI_274940 [Entamoeba dispar SAW760]|eukprot:EDR25479.1 hypothetical protein EDI_274940 [Entamoeba dispar SAW760]